MAYGMLIIISDLITRHWQIPSDSSGHDAVAPAVDTYWRLIIAIGSIPALISIVLRFRIPETPRWYMTRKEINMLALTARSLPRQDVHTNTGARGSRNYAYDETQDKRVSKYLRGMISYLMTSEYKRLRALLGVMFVWFIIDMAFYGLGLDSPERISIIWKDSQASSNLGLIYDEIWGTQATDITIYNLLKQDAMRRLVSVAMPAVAGGLAFLLIIDYIPRVAWLGYWFFSLGAIFLIGGTMLAVGLGFNTSALMNLLYLLAQMMFSLGPHTIRFILPAELFDTEYRATFYAVSSATGKVGSIMIQIIFYSCKVHFDTLLLMLCPILLLGAAITWTWIPEVQYTRGHSAEDRGNASEETGNKPQRRLLDRLVFPNRPLEEISAGQSAYDHGEQSSNIRLRRVLERLS
jgi:PHS family inorganic phosphate transporter-like MFS transporter